jgi:hypothetical protein
MTYNLNNITDFATSDEYKDATGKIMLAFSLSSINVVDLQEAKYNLNKTITY